MSVDGVASSASLLAALRGEMARQGERVGGAHRKTVSPTPEEKQGFRHDKNRLRAEIREIVRNATLSDEDAMRSVRRRIVRAMLLWEFGTDLREHPEWQPMLESITRTLESSAQHRVAFEALVRQFR
ncbi:hypothetical protein [Solilutibacter silvestris]|uniref:hypothetical protein n=1 Tax=Solilutibacter silvestris TaxID=1645665 RepID=UPI003D330E0F